MVMPYVHVQAVSRREDPVDSHQTRVHGCLPGRLDRTAPATDVYILRMHIGAWKIRPHRQRLRAALSCTYGGAVTLHCRTLSQGLTICPFFLMGTTSQTKSKIRRKVQDKCRKSAALRGSCRVSPLVPASGSPGQARQGQRGITPRHGDHRSRQAWRVGRADCRL